MTDRITIARHEGDPDRYLLIPLRDAEGERANPAGSFTGDPPAVVTADDTEITTTWASDAYAAASAVYRKIRVPLGALAGGQHQLERAVIVGDNDVDLRHVFIDIV